MWNMLWPILIVVCANTVYNICAKGTPETINSFAVLAVTYTVAALVSLVLFFATSGQKNLFQEFTKLNWAPFVLGLSIVALEFGYICVYRAGWKISLASLVANIALACILVLVGVLVYRETVTITQVLGVVVCAVGLILLSR